MLLSPFLKISLFNKEFHSFHFFGVLGFGVGMVLGIWICYIIGLQVPVIFLLSLIGAFTFFLLAFAAKVIFNRENIVYYHHEIAILLCCTFVLRLLRFPILPYLDVTLIGIATFLAFGRIGCFSVGCCHGKPARHGVVYRREHVKKGFTWYYEGIPLLPVQLIESVIVFMLVIVGIVVLLSRPQPGTFLIMYTIFYGMFRFVIEFFRGDSERPYAAGLSEAQWTTLLLIAISVVASFSGIIPFYTWHVVFAVGVFVAALYVIVLTRYKFHFLLPDHIKQIAYVLSKLNNDNNPPASVYCTNFGLKLSKGQLLEDGKIHLHYSISGSAEIALNLPRARKIADLIQQLERHTGTYKMIPTQSGVFHIVFE